MQKMSETASVLPSNDEYFITAEELEKGGVEDAGPVGFMIKKAELIDKTFKGVPGKAVNIQAVLVVRPGEGKLKLQPMVLDSIPLFGGFIKKFDNLRMSAGVKMTDPKKKYLMAEIVKALEGRSLFGLLEHNTYTKDGQKITNARFKKFGTSMESVTPA